MAQPRITTIIQQHEAKLKAAIAENTLVENSIRGMLNDFLGDVMATYTVADLIASKAKNDYLSGKD